MTVRIGELSKRAGVSIHTLRYYERRGLLPPAARAPSNYREYPALTLDRLEFIRHAQALGFTLTEVREFLELRTTPNGCATLRARGEQKLREVDAEIARLSSVKAGLRTLLQSCDAPATCDVIIDLEALRR